MRIRMLFSLVLLSSAALLFGQGSSENKTVSNLPIVAVSILPQAYFIDQLAKDSVQTVVLVTEGQDPHSYEPTPSQMAALSKAKLWILSGTDFEHSLVDKVAALYPNLTIVDGTRNMELRSLEEHDHQSGESDSGAQGLNIDRHTWLGWSQSKILLENTKQALIDVLSLPSALLNQRSEAFSKQIDQTFSALQQQLQPMAGSTIFVYHPSFGYFLDSFSLKQEAVETGGKEPTARDLTRLIEQAKVDGVKTIFVQKQFPVSSAQTVAKAVGATVVALDPLAYDWLANIQQMGEALLGSGGVHE
ncbi:metal ABC transporter solute-binding protein, Zn/Mn family [Sphaerochaeta sp.]|uniref:metal ABC transporter solute-binding protein, Zn/Mn family n=1 Tax=Sphaerochaeta sp. TaxID=1972642 RepID=UPI002FC99D37